MNTFGRNIRLTTFGESHGPAMGGILDGMPSCIKIDFEKVQEEVDKRAPGKGVGISARKERDKVEFLSGFSTDGTTLGSPIGFIVRNEDVRSQDYDGYENNFRPNHSDLTYYKKYGIDEFRGGGRSSARETVSRVVAGAVCRQWLENIGIKVEAKFIETNSVAEVERSGDSTGGIVECKITGVPIGIGEPVYDKLHSRLASAMMSINAAKAFEYGDGCKAAFSKGVESADIPYIDKEGEIRFRSNHSGGIQGGISNGMPILFRVYFKPTPTVMKPLKTINKKGEEVMLEPKGRHDACVAIRAVPVVEAMALMCIADFISISGMR